MPAPSVTQGLNMPQNSSDQSLQVYGSTLSLYRGKIGSITWSAAQAHAAVANGVHEAVTDNGTTQVITTGITNPPCARNITATPGGTSTDINDACVVTITGTDIDGNVITETLPAFTENATTAVVGSKAFLTVTSISIGAHDGNGATTAIGYGDKLGLPLKFARNPVLRSFLGTTPALEGTAATVAVSATALESNTVDLNSALDGTPVTIELALF